MKGYLLYMEIHSFPLWRLGFPFSRWDLGWRTGSSLKTAKDVIFLNHRWLSAHHSWLFGYVGKYTGYIGHSNTSLLTLALWTTVVSITTFPFISGSSSYQAQSYRTILIVDRWPTNYSPCLASQQCWDALSITSL